MGLWYMGHEVIYVIRGGMFAEQIEKEKNMEINKIRLENATDRHFMRKVAMLSGSPVQRARFQPDVAVCLHKTFIQHERCERIAMQSVTHRARQKRRPWP